MADNNGSTEQNILDAAKEIFVTKGMAGARMQEIADKAGINKALLHYYFRSKDKLFEAVFNELLSKLIPDLSELLLSKISLFEKIKKFTRFYIDTILENPLLPVFILHELNRNPEKIARTIKAFGIQPELLIDDIKTEIENGNINPIEPLNLIVNLLSMCIFPIIARPIIQDVLFEEEEDQFAKFIEQRKEHVSEFVINAIRIK